MKYLRVVKEHIKKILKEYKTPPIIFEIVLNRTISEQLEFIKLVRTDEGGKTEIFSNPHSKIQTGSQSKYSRIDVDDITDSLMPIIDVVIELSKRVLSRCSDKCAIVVSDHTMGFDYQMWVSERINGNIRLIINTSIRHPQHLFNTRKDPVIIVHNDDSISIKESKNKGKKIVKIYYPK